MAKLDFASFQQHLSAFDFPRLFVDVLGWNHAPVAERGWQDDATAQHTFSRRMVAELGGVAVLQVVLATGWPDEATRAHIWKHLSQRHVENILIFTDQRERASQSLWYWVKRSKDEVTGKPKTTPRRHEYFRGQPVDLFASKLQAMVVELSELDAAGRMPVLEAARRIQSALDVERTTKRFFTSYSEQHEQLLGQIEGIDDERDRRWYASVILNRLMFVWFMQKKGFLDHADYDYLPRQFTASQARGPGRFFGEFLSALFFEAFAKPTADRTATVRTLTGDIPYLNGGLFLHHPLELDANKQPRLGVTLRISDRAFEGIFKLFAAFSWNLDDTPGGDADEINPDVLGYIFEKYINQKAFGAYYTRPEITNYLAERSIHKLVLERINAPAVPELGLKEINFGSVPDMLAKMDNVTALKLVNGVLPSINILDPAVGSGAFLVAALKVLVNIYSAVVGRAELGASDALQAWLRAIQKEHPSVAYYIKRHIVTDNLYGVDIMQEATEIAKLRLFLTMVSSVRKVEELEPLPNIDFNILPGNSLVGLMRVDEHEFECKQDDLFKTPFRSLLDDKNRKLETYRHTADLMGREVDLRSLRDDIDQGMSEATSTLNELLRDQFEALGVKYEQATWDAIKKTLGKPKKLKITREHIDEQTPFHWGYMFDEIMQKRGGFDIILANPPWESFKPFAREFFAQHSKYVTKRSMKEKEFEELKDKLLGTGEIRASWLAYESKFPHLSTYFRSAPEYAHQFAVVEGKRTGSDLNLYKLFVERIFNLLRPGGHCGLVIPAGIYMDLGATGLRNLLFEEAKIEGMVGFENRKEIFEDVHRSIKFVVLTFEKCALPRLQVHGERNASAPPDDLLVPSCTGETGTQSFPAAFMRAEVADLARFPDQNSINLDVNLIKKLSPESHSIMEFKSERDIEIAGKLLKQPMLGEALDDTWNVRFGSEFHMTSDKALFRAAPDNGRLRLYEGKMMWQFDCQYAEPTRWIVESEGRQALIGSKEKDSGQKLGYQMHRLVFRSAGENTNERNLIATILPKNVFCGNSLTVSRSFSGNAQELMYLCAVLNSFVLDWLLRLKIQRNLNMFLIYQLPVPRPVATNILTSLAVRAARLICTTQEFGDLASEIGGDTRGVTDSIERACLRAELDGLVAHLYGLTESEFAHILATFPLVADPVKQAARNAWRDVERGLIQ
jgi:hypothetical protein